MSIKKYRFVVVPTLVISTAMLSLIFVAPRQVKRMIKQWREIESIKKNIKEQKVKYLLISSLNKEKLEQQASLAVAALPEDKSVSYILRGARNAVKESGFMIRSLKFTPGEITKKKKKKNVERQIEELPLEMKVFGPLDRLTELFDAIEKTLPLFQVDTIEAAASQKVTSNINLVIKLTTFYSPPPSIYKNEVVKLEDLILSEKESDFLNNLSGFKQTAVVGEKSHQSKGKKRDNPFLF